MDERIDLSSDRKIIFISRHSLGDAVVFSAFIRDLHKRYPGRFVTNVVTANVDSVWKNNPYVTPVRFSEGRTVRIYYADEMRSALVLPIHFMEGFINNFNRTFIVDGAAGDVKLTSHKPDLYLSEIEQAKAPFGLTKPYWVMVAGGKSDITTKWWEPENYQAVVDGLKDVQFVQAGNRNHYHPTLNNVVNLVGKTNARQFIHLVAHAEGVVCPVTAAMHIAAAFDKKAVIIAGGREPAWWELYHNHTFLHTLGRLTCCEKLACYRATTTQISPWPCTFYHGIGDVGNTIPVAGCMHLITPDVVINAVKERMSLPTVEVIVTKPEIPQPVKIEFVNTKPVVRNMVKSLGDKFTVCTCFYGGAPGNETYASTKTGVHSYYDLHKRWLDGFLATTPLDRVELRIGLNGVGADSEKLIYGLPKELSIGVYGPNENIYKYPRLRMMLYDDDNPITTEWVVQIDDDADFIYGNWVDLLEPMMIQGIQRGARCFGEHYMFFLRPNQLAWHKKRYWWKGRDPIKYKSVLSRVDFITGGWWAMRFADLKELNWPDPELRHNGGDVMLGSAMYQQGWPIFNCSKVIDVHNSPTRGFVEKHPSV